VDKGEVMNYLKTKRLKMTKKELYRLELLAERNKQFLEVLRFKVPREGMGIYQRIHAEVFLDNVDEINEIIMTLETLNDILFARETIKKLNITPDPNWREIIDYTLEMLEEMRNALIFNRFDEFDFIKERVLHMLAVEVEEAMAG